MPRQRKEHHREAHAFPEDFPRRLERLKEESGLNWSEFATGLAAQGAAVGCLARTESDLRSVVERIRADGGSAIAVRCDVTDETEVETATAAVADKFGGLDTVVLNAGGDPTRGAPAIRVFCSTGIVIGIVCRS